MAITVITLTIIDVNDNRSGTVLKLLLQVVEFAMYRDGCLLVLLLHIRC